MAEETPEVSGFRQQLGEARAVRRYSLELAHAVREGSRRLDEALAEALGLYFEEPARSRLDTATFTNR
jgi:hypothetical protein